MFFYYLNIIISFIYALAGLLLIRTIANKSPNLWFGIRNKYTLSNKEIWRKTNRSGGIILIISGLILLIPNLFIGPSNEKFYLWFTLISPIAVIVILGIATWIISKRLSEE
ncbi:SdpI family protein [Caloranaerobacter azorensis]|uniref:SdpI/YhfL protein family n=2 Tax=Caloranaerobacter azorensis TaxID=116090 RepID=A0A096BHZ7_9FIRM|nr:SdpI family protein [Caloranaerobacter azorensis]KGG80492.1 hypothetical protein Y919_06005 [Caloranaerobacter azorensis H53214]QIB27351.1 SdpI family protein [Caloranaerobacter azorensis]